VTRLFAWPVVASSGSFYCRRRRGKLRSDHRLWSVDLDSSVGWMIRKQASRARCFSRSDMQRNSDLAFYRSTYLRRYADASLRPRSVPGPPRSSDPLRSCAGSRRVREDELDATAFVASTFVRAASPSYSETVVSYPCPLLRADTADEVISHTPPAYKLA